MYFLNDSVDFFMGAVGADGFHGYFHELDLEPDIQLHLIKAGPGCGKSTLMQQVAKASPLPVERIHCSSDPDSLDGVILHKPFAAVLDATAPHVLEPAYPGACQQVVDLYHTLDNDFLTANRCEIVALFQQCSTLQQRAARYIAAAANLLEDSCRAVAKRLDLSKLDRYTRRLAARYLPHTDGTATESIRLLSAITPKGPILFHSTIAALAPQKIVFHDEYGSAAPLILAHLRQHALDCGYSIVTCPCPLHPGRIEHLFIPQLGLAFLTSKSWHLINFEGQKNIHCTRFEAKDSPKPCSKRLRFNRKAVQQLLAQASCAQREAKQQHDKLEHYYKSAVDFCQVNKITATLIQRLIPTDC